jgi:high mobility group protein B1
MGKNKDVNKPKGRMSAYTFFVQTCREEHRKKHPNENVNFTEFSKKCAERWKVSRKIYFRANRLSIGPISN